MAAAAAVTASVNNDTQREHDQQPHIVIEDEDYLTSDKEDDAGDINNSEKQSPGTSTYNRPFSGYSILTSSNASTKSPSRSYKFVQLERALLSARILKTNDDRLKFENEYIIAIREHSFDKFEREYYKKIQDYDARIKREKELKEIRRFTFTDFEQKFLATYPTRDIKIIFVDESNPSTITRTTNTRSASAHPKSATLAPCDKEAIELFYADRAPVLMNNPERAKKEIESYVSRAAHSLSARLPRVINVPHRVKIVDERDRSDKPNERILLEMNHKHAISSVAKRRHLLIKMMAQTKKNQTRMEKQWKRTAIGVDKPTCYREMLEIANQTDDTYRERPQTATAPQKRPTKSLPLSASVDTSQTRINTTLSSSSCLTPFQDSLTLLQVENTKNVRVVFSKRPLTAPTKMEWVNYC